MFQNRKVALLPLFFKGSKIFLIVAIKPPFRYPKEKAMAPHSSTLAWKIPWMEDPGRLQSFGSLRVSCIGEGNGNPLQFSCLENLRDRGAWRAAVYGVAQSRTWLKRLSSSRYPKARSLVDHWCPLSLFWIQYHRGHPDPRMLPTNDYIQLSYQRKPFFCRAHVCLISNFNQRTSCILCWNFSNNTLPPLRGESHFSCPILLYLESLYPSKLFAPINLLCI